LTLVPIASPSLAVRAGAGPSDLFLKRPFSAHGDGAGDPPERFRPIEVPPRPCKPAVRDYLTVCPPPSHRTHSPGSAAQGLPARSGRMPRTVIGRLQRSGR
jgi:hypothetical protein